ncbi:hypothetical protein DFQ29_001984 [Apophysomyces sp. BC1021]|nr:hypothetical protein DFQ29_001984 [Apophysomyces sp. BC1021]
MTVLVARGLTALAGIEVLKFLSKGSLAASVGLVGQDKNICIVLFFAMIFERVNIGTSLLAFNQEARKGTGNTWNAKVV